MHCLTCALLVVAVRFFHRLSAFETPLFQVSKRALKHPFSSAEVDADLLSADRCSESSTKLLRVASNSVSRQYLQRILQDPNCRFHDVLGAVTCRVVGISPTRTDDAAGNKNKQGQERTSMEQYAQRIADLAAQLLLDPVDEFRPFNQKFDLKTDPPIKFVLTRQPLLHQLMMEFIRVVCVLFAGGGRVMFPQYASLGQRRGVNATSITVDIVFQEQILSKRTDEDVNGNPVSMVSSSMWPESVEMGAHRSALGLIASLEQNDAAKQVGRSWTDTCSL